MVTNNEKNGTVGLNQQCARQRDNVVTYFEDEMRDNPPKVIDIGYITDLFRKIENYINKKGFFMPRGPEAVRLETAAASEEEMRSDYNLVAVKRQWTNASMRAVTRIAKSYVEQDSILL